ncbi:MAG: Lrp/AsnC family transcriptional regulator [Fidelibacterota bacterium]
MLDNIDFKILDVLQDDGRIPFIELGRLIGLTRQAVTRRVNNLSAAGYIKKFTVDLDHDLLGKPIIAYVDIIFQTSLTTEVEEATIKYILKINGVRVANTTVDEKHITIKIRTRDIQDLNQVVRSIQNDLPGVSTHTVLVNELFFSNKKISYSED